MGSLPTHGITRLEAELAPGDFLLSFTDGVVEVERQGRAVTLALKVCEQSIRSRIFISPANLFSKPLLAMFTTLPVRKS